MVWAHAPRSPPRVVGDGGKPDRSGRVPAYAPTSMFTSRAWLLSVVLLPACTTYVPPPEIPLTGADPMAAWARVLSTHVDAEGRIDFEAMKTDSRDLDTFVAYVAQTDPQSAPASFPSRDERVAFYLNSYNALAMYNVLHAGVLPVDTAKFFYFRALKVGGRWISLYDYENSVIRPLGEERVHFALNCMVRACPRLPQQPFVASNLEQQLDAAAREFCNKSLHVEPHAETSKVRLSQIMEFYTADFLQHAPSLIAYCNRYRLDPIPLGYAVEFIPYDWTLNQSPK